MSNRVYLFTRSLGSAGESSEENVILLSAEYFIPVLWCSLFTAADIVMLSASAEDEDDEGDEAPELVEYPALLVDVSTARQRSSNAQAAFFEVFPRSLEPLYRQWLDTLDGVSAAYLDIDTIELAEMEDEPASLATLLRSCLQPYQNTEQRDWSVLLRQAGIEYDPANNPEHQARYRLSPVRGRVAYSNTLGRVSERRLSFIQEPRIPRVYSGFLRVSSRILYAMRAAVSARLVE